MCFQNTSLLKAFSVVLVWTIGENASTCMRFHTKTHECGPRGVDGLTLLGRFIFSEYRAMLYSRLETQRKEREERQFNPPRAKRQKTHEEPKVNISNIGYNLGVVCSFL